MTPLDKTLKRALTIHGTEYVVTLSPEALKLTRKGRRLGLELKWADLTSGESALAVALHASVGQFETDRSGPDKGGTVKSGSPRKVAAAGSKSAPPRSRIDRRSGKAAKFAKSRK